MCVYMYMTAIYTCVCVCTYTRIYPYLYIHITQLGDGFLPDEDAPVLSRAAYQAHATARLRTVAMQDVPGLAAASFDFVLVRQLRIGACA